jgi:hypothetical protein
MYQYQNSPETFGSWVLDSFEFWLRDLHFGCVTILCRSAKLAFIFSITMSSLLWLYYVKFGKRDELLRYNNR